MAPSSRVKIAVISALLTGGAVTAASQAEAQPMPVDPALPPAPGVAAPMPPAPGDAGTPTRNQVFTYTPIGEGGAVEGPPPAPPPPPGTAPYIPPVPNADFNNTGQLSYLRELWNMRSPEQLFGALNPSEMDPATAGAMGVRQMPMLPPGTLPPGATAADYPMLAPGSSPPDVAATDMPMLPPGTLPPGVVPSEMPMPPPDVAALEMSVLEEVLPPGVLPPEAPADVVSPAPPPGAPPAPASAPPPVWPPVGMVPAP